MLLSNGTVGDVDPTALLDTLVTTPSGPSGLLGERIESLTVFLIIAL